MSTASIFNWAAPTKRFLRHLSALLRNHGVSYGSDTHAGTLCGELARLRYPDAVKREGVRRFSIGSVARSVRRAMMRSSARSPPSSLLPDPRKPPCSAARQDRHPDGGAAERHHKPRLRFDDTHLRHHSPFRPVASALFALAEYRPVSGAELLHAFILGVEVECRIGNASIPTITMSAGTSPEPRACSARLLRRASFSAFPSSRWPGHSASRAPNPRVSRDVRHALQELPSGGARHRTAWFGASGGEELHQLHSGDRSQARLCDVMSTKQDYSKITEVWAKASR